MKFSLLIFFMSLQFISFAQKESLKDYNFVLNKIRNVYAGYNDKIVEVKFSKILNEIKLSKSQDTFMLLSKMTSFFNDYHLSLFQKNILETIDSSVLNKNLEYIRREKKGKGIERSYWINEFNNKIIYLTKKSKNIYEAYVVESKNNNVVGLKLFAIQDMKEKKWKTDFINIDRNFRIFTNSFFKNSNTLIIGSYEKFKRIDKYYEGFLDSKHENFKKAEFLKLNTRSVLLKMPSFNEEFIDIYDSLIKSNNTIICESEHLIIDLRNNQGGYTNCFDSIIPFVCNTGIITSGGFTLCSKELIENAKEGRDESIKSKDSNTIKYYNNYINNLEKHKNSFHFIEGDTIKCNFKKSNLKQISILVNYGCRSAAELMILYLKQSSKVKVFGEPTAGAVDYLDILSYTLPQTNYKLWVGSVKRELNTTQPSYDANGINPDIIINENIADWVNYVKNYYEKN